MDWRAFIPSRDRSTFSVARSRPAKPRLCTFIYPQLGEINAADPKPARMKRLAELITSPQDGRLTRTMVNRLWQRFMGQGIVEPADDMDKEPWNADLLD